MSDCCDNFVTDTLSATREPSCAWIADDDCGFRDVYKGVAGTQYNSFMPVKFGTIAGTVVPALDGVDAIGFATTTLLATAAVRDVSVVRKAAMLPWKCMASAVGQSPTDFAAFWAVHKELAKVGIYTKF